MAEKKFGKFFYQNFFSKIFFDRRKNFIFHFIKKMKKKTAGHNLVVNLCFEKLSNRMKIERMRPERVRVRNFTPNSILSK